MLGPIGCRLFSSVKGVLKYTTQEEWVKKIIKENDCLMIFGITFHAQSKLGDLVFIEVNDKLVGKDVKTGDVVLTIESSKATSDLEMPMDGTVVEVNSALADNPEIVNESPEEKGWLVKFKPNDPSKFDEFMDEEEYKKSHDRN
jgi:glycine cleavage system H protein